MGQQYSKAPSGFIPDFRDPDIQNVSKKRSINFDLGVDQYSKYLLNECAYTGSFIALLLLLSWLYGQSDFEKPLDPVEAAIEERDAAVKERDDAQCAWAEMGTKHERVLEKLVKLQDEYAKAFKDLPWLNKRIYEIAEENSVQHNEIERLKLVEQQHEELLHQVSRYGMAAKRPEYYQQRSENVQRELEISNNLLHRSQICVKALEDKFSAQHEKAKREIDYLRARIKKNSRSTAYWAKVRTANHALEPNPAWGVRCACTEPEIAYSLKDQTPRIVELEATVAARDATITRLRASHGNALNKYTASASNVAKTSLPSKEDSISLTTTGSQPAKTTLLHACEYEQRCKNLERQVADDAKFIRELREECQELRDAASNESTRDAAEIDGKAGFEAELAAKDATIKELREDNTARNAELAAKEAQLVELREEKRSADENAAAEISNLDGELSDTRNELVDARAVAAERERELGQQRTRVNELETAQGALEDAIKQKNREIDELEQANQEIAEQPAPESAETLQRLRTANTNLDELRRQHTACEEQSETHTVRISELEAAGRNLEATTKLKDDRIARLEEQINAAPTVAFIESQNQYHNEAISEKDREYQALYDLYQQTLGRQQLAEAKRDENMQAFNSMQQDNNAKQLELQRLWTEYTNLGNVHTNCNGRIADLTNQLRQGANTHTDLQVKYNTQATELDEITRNARELRSQVARLQQAIANLEQKNSSESDFEAYRLEGENRARPVWQANFDREMSTQALKLETTQGLVFKLESQLQQVKNQANPLREMQLKAREDAVKLREDALKFGADDMDHDQQGGNSNPETKILEGKLAAANKEAGDARVRNRGIQSQLNKERKERKEEKERHERELKKEQEDSMKRSDIMKLRLEKENPLRGTVSKLQDEVARLSKELKERT